MPSEFLCAAGGPSTVVSGCRVMGVEGGDEILTSGEVAVPRGT